MKFSRLLSLVIAFIFIVGAQGFAQEKTGGPNEAGSTVVPVKEKTVVLKTKILSSDQLTGVVAVPSRKVIKRKQEEIILLKKLMREIDEPKEGVDELIRQEKMRLLIEKVNNSLDVIETARKDQEKQLQIIESQRAVLNQQRNLPKR